MDTILATTSASSNENGESTEPVVIQQHDTVVNNNVKKDICNVADGACPAVTPAKDQPAIEAQNEERDTLSNDVMEVEESNMQDPVSGSENVKFVLQVDHSDVTDNAQPESMPITLEDLRSNAEPEPKSDTTILEAEMTEIVSTDVKIEAKDIDAPNEVQMTDCNIDAAISGNIKVEGDAANGYESSDLDSSSDEEADTKMKKEGSVDMSSSDDSDSDSDSDDELQLPTKSMTIEEREKLLIDISWMDDEDGAANNVGEPLRTRNEIKDIVVQPPTVTLKPEAKIVEIGTVYAVVESTVVVQGQVSGDERVLDSGSLFVFEDKEILGEIFETFGPVAKPLYSVRFNDASEIDAERTKQGAKVYIVPDLSTYVLTRALKMQKGSDASNIHDEEIDESEMAFSDDEAEMAHKRQQKQKKGKKRPAEQPALPAEPTWEDLDGYNVLKRPALNAQPPPPQRQPHPLPARPAVSMPPATLDTSTVHSISQLFAGGPPPLHQPPREQ